VLRQFPDAALSIPDADDEDPDEELEDAPQPEPPDPWSFLSAEALARPIDTALELDPNECPASGVVLVPAWPVSIRSALRDALPAGAGAELAFELRLENLEMADMERLICRFSPVESVVDCWVSDSMAAGSWSLLEFRLGNRGYLCDQPDYGIDADESLPILGAWEPAADDVARRACILSGYERDWHNRAWPPFMGQWASGDPALLRDAIVRVVKTNAVGWARDAVLERLTRGGDSYEHVQAVAELNDVPPERVVQVLGLMACQDEEFVTRWRKGTSSDEERRIVVGLLVRLMASGPGP
jgi:hypothetical protein